MFLDLKKWVKSIQTAGYDGTRTVLRLDILGWTHYATPLEGLQQSE